MADTTDGWSTRASHLSQAKQCAPSTTLISIRPFSELLGLSGVAARWDGVAMPTPGEVGDYVDARFLS